MRFVPASDASLLVVLDGANEASAPSPDTVARVHALFRALTAAAPAWLVDVHPAYASVLIDFDSAAADHDAVAAAVGALTAASAVDAIGRVVELPVRYDGADLAFVAAHAGCSVDDVVRRHATAYTVAFLGFAPGFAYLLGLDPGLAVPRLEVPRARVEAGAVAIGGAQTAVYPRASPGGWRVIGHVAPALVEDPAWVGPGDVVRFTPVQR